jgi:hypothetical protein
MPNIRKARMGATHFLTKTLPEVAAENGISVLTRVMNIDRRGQAVDRCYRRLRYTPVPAARTNIQAVFLHMRGSENQLSRNR